MATSKLIKPTNVTVSIPEFTDRPDQRVNSNCVDKTIDGVNSLSDQIGNLSPSAYTAPTNLGTGVTVDNGGYVQIGKLVIVNCRLNIASAIQSNIAKFPASGLTSTHVSVANNKSVDMGIDQNGYLNAGASVSSGIAVITTVYFAM